ncbi:hypothetical protein EON63_24165 [archaeon]|nr:MAG: hypothetical protein EON63_24165 [archaeon]
MLFIPTPPNSTITSTLTFIPLTPPGDPNRITIGGQSAGAMSVGAHMTSPNSKGMFAGAIMESNPLALPFHSRDTASENADAVFE